MKFLFLFLLICQLGFADEKLKAAIDQVIAENAPNAHIGYQVISLCDGKIVCKNQENHLFVPASNAKTFTSVAALFLLGEDYRFTTRVYIDEKTGDLYLKGSGDPELSIRELDALVLQLKKAGFLKIKGRLYVDNTDFDDIPLGPGWMWDEGAEFWNSPMDALTVNHSCVNILIKPGKAAPEVALYPETTFVTVRNLATISQENTDLKVTRRWMTKENIIEVNGPMAKSHEPMEFLIPIESPSLYTGHVFRELLLANGITFTGSVESKAVPSTAKEIASHSSRPLSLIVQDMMKHSDNLTADCLFKKIGHAETGEQGTWQNGNKVLRAFLKEKVGIPSTSLVLLDGCGLSRYNLVSPAQLVQLLTWARANITSEVCTSEKRFANLPFASQIRAKTGAMTGISTLSGYLTTKNGETLIFALMGNGFTMPVAEYREKVENRICEILANQIIENQ